MISFASCLIIAFGFSVSHVNSLNLNLELMENILGEEAGSRFVKFDSNASRCIFKCITSVKLPRNVTSFFHNVGQDVFKKENSTNIRRLFNATMLDWYCGFANERQMCFLNCEDGEFKQEILKFLRTTSYVCNETEFIEYSKCYRNVYEEDVDGCESGDKCLPYKLNAVRWIHIPPAERNISQLDSMIADGINSLCQYVSCGNQCRQRELISKCGQEESDTLTEFYRRLISSTKQFLSFLSKVFRKRDIEFNDNCHEL